MKIIKTLFVAAFALVAGYTVYSTQQNTEMSDLALANVEALADTEIEIGPFCIDNWQICHIYSPGDHIDGIKVK